MSDNLKQPDKDPSQSSLPGRLAVRHLLAKLSMGGQPRMAERQVVEHNGNTYVRYRRPDQVTEGFEQTSQGGDFYTRDFRGKPGNVHAVINDESGAQISGEVGHIKIPHRPSGDIEFVIKADGTLDEVLSDHGRELHRKPVIDDGVYEVTDLIDSLQPGTMWWQDGVPQFPNEQPNS